MKNKYKMLYSMFLLFTIFSIKHLFGNEFKKEDFVAGIALKDFGHPGWAKKYTASTLDAVRNSATKWISIHYFR